MLTEHPLTFENQLCQEGFSLIAGIDEAGRGPLAGPVVAAACLIKGKEGLSLIGVDDSKKLTPKRRAALFSQIKENPFIEYGIGIVDAQAIDALNIYQATLLAMRQAVSSLPTEPSALLVDAMPLTYQQLKVLSIIKGDSRSYTIALASIIAKETRDELMLHYHERWPEYNFKQHKGYGTFAHMEAIAQYGPCPIHRMSFAPLKSRL